MEDDQEQEDVARVGVWVGRLQEFASSLDGIQGTKAIDFCENACEAWQGIAWPDIPPKTSPAILIAFETLGVALQVM